MPLVAVLLAGGAAVAAEPAVPTGPEDLELTAEQAQERLELRRSQATEESRSRHDGRAASETDAARLRERHAVERLRQQARQEEQRYQRALRRPDILPDAGDAHRTRRP